MGKAASGLPRLEGRPHRRGAAPRHVIGIVLTGLLLGLAAPAFADDGPASVPARSTQVSRWVSNLSGGYVFGGHVGLVKSVWWYAMPDIFALGLSFDYIGPFIPLSVNVAVQAPLSVVAPFLCVGAGVGITGHGIMGYGGGVRFRITQKAGFVIEYRRYRYNQDSRSSPRHNEWVVVDYMGAGISWGH